MYAVYVGGGGVNIIHNTVVYTVLNDCADKNNKTINKCNNIQISEIENKNIPIRECVCGLMSGRCQPFTDSQHSKTKSNNL